MNENPEDERALRLPIDGCACALSSMIGARSHGVNAAEPIRCSCLSRSTSRAAPPSWPLSTLLSTLLLTTGAAAQSSMQRVDVDSLGNRSDLGSNGAVISADGRCVLFASADPDLVPGDTNGRADVFVHDRVTGMTERVSVDSAGVQANGDSECHFVTSISSDGRFVVYYGAASNLVPNDSNGAYDVFVRDRLLSQTVCASVTPGGVPGNGDSRYAALSQDGRFVAFSSSSSDLVPSAPPGGYGLFVRDLVNAQTVRADVDSAGNPSGGSCSNPALSGDGRVVAFDSTSSQLVPGDTNGDRDVFIHDFASGQTARVSVDSAGNQGLSASSNPTISADGRFVAFHSNANTFVAGDTNGTSDVFVHDRSTGETRRVSVDSAGNQQNSGSLGNTAISADGRYVAFDSYATNLVPLPPNNLLAVFVHDLQSGETIPVNVTPGHQAGNGPSERPSLSADGRWIAFNSAASDLVPLDRNGRSDAFVHDRFGCTFTAATYCTAPTTSHGCVPSIQASGTPSASAGVGFTISVQAVEGQKAGLFFFGLSGSRSTPFGAGSSVLCVQGPLRRSPVQSSGGTGGACDGVLTLDWNQFVGGQSTPWGDPIAGGETIWIQAWFRDPLAPGGSNLSNAMWFTLCP